MKKKNQDIELIIKNIMNENYKEKGMMDKKIPNNEKSRRDFDAFVEVWEKSADLKEFDRIDAAGDWQKVRSKIKFNSTKLKIPAGRYLLRIAAILILALGLTYTFTRLVKKATPKQEYYFETLALNDVKKVELPDGSTVFLNKNSKIIRNADFGLNNRDIILEGEALFNVAHNEKLTFRVHTLNTIIEDIGTRFDIKADTTQVIVGVLSGRVLFYQSTNTANRVELLPQCTGYYNSNNNDLKADSNFDQNRIAWHTGVYSFRNKPMQETIEDLADLFNLTLSIDPEIDLNESPNVTCNGHTLNDIIVNLNIALHSKNIEVEATNNKLIVRKP
jgi:transmembrane sensor